MKIIEFLEEYKILALKELNNCMTAEDIYKWKEYHLNKNSFINIVLKEISNSYKKDKIKILNKENKI